MIELVIVSRLLEYPDAALWQHQQEMFEAIAASKNLPKEDAHALGIFLRDLTTMDPLDAQAQYSELFDRGRATSLLLFEHVHGESRDRGQAMVDLLAQYEQHGLQLKQPRIAGPSAAVSGVPGAAAAKRSRGRFERYRADSGIAERASATA
ncbi:respiratory nitrate reductase 1 subunit delta [Escherichia coli]|nr:respiratory nitrate reductase 1 subunit delta [Escherichia coli]